MLPHIPLTAKVEGLSVYATAMYTMLMLFYLCQQKENYQIMGAFTRKSLEMAAIFLTSFDHQFLNAFFHNFCQYFFQS